MYSYEFKSKGIGINHREIFVVMSFAGKYDRIFNLIVKATEAANLELGFNKDQALKAYRTKDDIRTTSGWINVLEHLTRAQIVLGVLSGNNVNVFYELGIAHATQPITRQILIAKKSYRPSFDTKDLIYFPYDDRNLKGSVAGLTSKIVDAIRTYDIEKEKEIKRARQQLGPHDFETLIIYGNRRNFAVETSEEYEKDYEKQHGRGSLNRHIQGITNLCRNRLLTLNTASAPKDKGTQVEFSYYWTNLGSDLLLYLKLMDEETLMKWRVLPESIAE